MNIFEINEKITNFLATHINEETGEIENIEEFEALNMMREEKIENTVMFLKNKKALLTMLKDEKKTIDERIKSTEKLIERIENLIEYSLQGQKFETSRCAVSYRKSEQVEVNEDLLPKKWFNKKVTYTVDKMGIKKMLKEGIKIKGATLVEKQNMQVK